MIVIEWFRRPGEGEIFRFDRPEVSLGLSPRNDLVLEGRGVLKKHCTFQEGPPGVYQLTSMSGKDAALVNGDRFFRGPVRNGDRIQVGSVHLVFRGDGTEPVGDLPPVAEARAESKPEPARRERVTGTTALPPLPRPTPAAERKSPPVVSRGSDSAGEAEAPYVNSVGGLVFPPADATDAGSPRRGRRPIELAEIPTTTPYGPLRREIHVIVRQRRPLLETAKLVFDALRTRYRSAEIFLASSDEAGTTPSVIAASGDDRGFVFSRKALGLIAQNRRPVATREGERVTTYFPLVAERESLRGFLVVRGTLGGLDREFFEEVAFLFSVRMAAVPSGAIAGAGGAAPPSPGPAVFDADSGALTENTDDLKAITEAVERIVIDRVMRRVKGNQSKGAAILNISRGSLISKVKQFGIPDYRTLRRR